MRKLALLLLMVATGMTTMAQDTTYWTKGGMATLNFNQTSLTNWAAGGVNSIAFNGYAAYIANYKKARVAWDNRIDLGYGLIRQGNNKQEFNKADDKIILTSKYGYHLSESGKLYLTTLLDFRTQFDKGFSPDDPDSLISNFMAPAYILAGIGLDYKPDANTSIYFTPLNGKFTIVNDDNLADQGAFGVDTSKNFRSELGTFIRATHTSEIFTNVVLDTKLELFTNYLKNFGYIDVNWELNLNMKVNKFITATVLTNLIYDDDIKIALETDADGNVLRSGPRAQFKSVIGVGLSYQFGSAIK